MGLSFFVGEPGSVSPWWFVAVGVVIGVLVWLWKRQPNDPGEVNVKANFEFSTRPAAKRSTRTRASPPSAAPEKPK